MTPSQAAQEKPTSPRTECGEPNPEAVYRRSLEATVLERFAPIMADHPMWVERRVCNAPGCGDEDYFDHVRAILRARLDEDSATPDQGKGEPPDPRWCHDRNCWLLAKGVLGHPVNVHDEWRAAERAEQGKGEPR